MMPHFFLLRTDSKALERQEIKVIGRIGAVTLFRDGLNVTKLSARRIGRSRETQMKLFDQTGSELGSTVFENSRDSIHTVSFPRINVREGMENVAMKNFNFRDEVVRGWRSMRNMPSIIQSRVDDKGLSVEFRV